MLRLSALYRYPLKSGKAEILQQVGLDKLGVTGIDAGCWWTRPAGVFSRSAPWPR